MVLLDVTPLSLGVETMGNVMTPLIQRNTTIPTSKSEVFSTAADGQTSVEIHVLQGERPMAYDNRTLGRFHLSDIPPAPRGIPQIEVTFDIDANGILHVSAKDKGTGREQKISITASSGLTKEDIDKMQKEATAHETDDKKKKEDAELRNQADNLAYTSEKTLKDNGDKVDAGTRDKVLKAIEELKEALKGTDSGKIKSGFEALQKEVYEMSSQIYKAQGPAAGQGQPQTPPQQESGPQGGEDKTINADWKESDQK